MTIDDFVTNLLRVPEMNEMGHAQRAEDRNLGLGWLYYALTRILRPRNVVCIGSWRGFVPCVLGRGVADNKEAGTVTFIDPSNVDDHWADADKTRQWFAGFGLDNIKHFHMTTQAFVETDAYRNLEPVDLLFVDGFHSAQQARFDHEAFESRLSQQAMVLFHDSVRYQTSYMYGDDNTYEHTVVDYMNELKSRSDLQVLDFPFDSGVTAVRRTLSPENFAVPDDAESSDSHRE